MRKILPLIIILGLLAEIAIAGVPGPGDKAPEFSLKTLDGKQMSLSDMKGKVVVIGMFHICVPCMNQAMEFNKVRDQFDESQVVILGINTNGDSKDAVNQYLSKFPEKVRFPYLLDPVKSFYQNYLQREMPTVLIIDKNGILNARAPGVGADQLVPYLKKML
ncbi:MAG: TlpA family protein disulfide reductase [Nitrospinae bacterium]|nr:TlpA family protein disulfide reductase [Nitrospinota bacterium]